MLNIYSSNVSKAKQTLTDKTFSNRKDKKGASPWWLRALGERGGACRECLLTLESSKHFRDSHVDSLVFHVIGEKKRLLFWHIFKRWLVLGVSFPDFYPQTVVSKPPCSGKSFWPRAHWAFCGVISKFWGVFCIHNDESDESADDLSSVYSTRFYFHKQKNNTWASDRHVHTLKINLPFVLIFTIRFQLHYTTVVDN